MNDPAEQWDSPLDRETPEPKAFFQALATADEKIADVAALRARLADTTVLHQPMCEYLRPDGIACTCGAFRRARIDATTPEWKPLAAGIALLVERYHADAATCDQEAAITNLASLLRHASAFAAALCGEVEHYAAEARDARAEARALRDQLAGVR